MNFIPYWESLHTHTHCMSWVIYLKFQFTGNFCADWTLKLSFISLHIWDAFWLLYQLIIHACSEANIRENIFFCNFSFFLFFSVKRPNGLSLRPDGCGSDSRTVRLHVQTHAAYHMLMWQRASGWVSDQSERGPYRLYIDAQTLAAASICFPTRFSLALLCFCTILSWVSAYSRRLLSFCAYFSPF
jgi:hypothetical protein